jgi:putative phage-type endonuclease
MKQQLSKHGIGASEISAIVGMNPFASPWDVWCRKTGQAPEPDDSAPIEWGHRLEPVIRQKYCDDTGAAIYVPTESLFHPERHWARATPDGIVVDDCAWKHLLQIKNVGYWMGREWDEAPPTYVQLQEQWELYVTGLDRADIACLIGGSDYRCYTVHRDDGIIQSLVTIAEDFWRRVETRTPPPVDDSDACRKHFESKLRRDAVELTADEEVEQLFAEWRELVKRQRADEKRIETIRNRVRQIMADAGASVIRTSIGDAKLSFPKPTGPQEVVNWKYVAELLGSTKCSKEEFAELVKSATATLTPEPKAPTLYAPRNWSKEK